MSAKTKIVVLHMKEIIYITTFILLGLMLVLLFLFMFLPGFQKKTSPTSGYATGIYTSSVTLDHTTLDVEVAVSDAKIQSVRIANLSDDISTMYPLLQPVVEDLSQQICKTQSLSDVTLTKSNPHTAQLLLDAAKEALESEHKK